jgi:hypothetical protein
MEPGTTGLASLQFCSAGINSTRFGVTNSASTESGHIHVCGNPWATTDSGMSGLYATGFCSLESDPTHGLIADSETTAPVTIADHRIDAKRIDSNKMDDPVTNYDPIGSYNLNSGTDGINNLGVQQRQSSSQGWQASTAGQFNSTNNGAYHSQHSPDISSASDIAQASQLQVRRVERVSAKEPRCIDHKGKDHCGRLGRPPAFH